MIDVQQYMLGPPRGSAHWYPSACGPAAVSAIEALSKFLPACRIRQIPIFYTRFELRRDGTDAGVYALKRGMPDTEGWCLEGSEGAKIIRDVAPAPRDIVLVKKKPSAFHGTPLLGHLLDRRIDTLLVAGGSTSNCVRATVVDAASYNFRTVVVEDCVFDRFERSHLTALFDMDRQYADVRDSCDTLHELDNRASGAAQ
ncbi:MAG TPA: isochorismatase family protein [Streptosporangiaceae bacterium]|nr:isochorismatase family protein [Streptosporangiaceae bacterium]